MKQWNSGTPQEEPFRPQWMDDKTKTEEKINSLRLNRIFEIVELCIAMRQMDACARLFVLVRHFKMTDVITKANSVYIPLISRLFEILQRTDTDICTYPFDLFLETTVSGYVNCVLGTKEHNPREPPPKIGCRDSGCSLCLYVDSFIVGSDRRRTFRVPNELQEHLERQIRLSNGVDSLEKQAFDGRSVTVEIIKSSATYAATSWQGRVNDAKDFFRAIGRDKLESIMGTRYQALVDEMKRKGVFSISAFTDGARRASQQTKFCGLGY